MIGRRGQLLMPVVGVAFVGLWTGGRFGASWLQFVTAIALPAVVVITIACLELATLRREVMTPLALPRTEQPRRCDHADCGCANPVFATFCRRCGRCLRTAPTPRKAAL